MKPEAEWSNISIFNSGLSQSLTASRMHLVSLLVCGVTVLINNLSASESNITLDFLDFH